MFYPTKKEIQSRECECCLFFDRQGRCSQAVCFLEREGLALAERRRAAQRAASVWRYAAAERS